jgi:hypothetical protein
MRVSAEEIAAFVDGELQPADRERVASAIAADPASLREAEQHRMLRAKLGAHFAPLLDQEVPDRLTALLTTQAPVDSVVVDLAETRRKRAVPAPVRRWGWVVGPALAASLALVLVFPRGEPVMPEYADTQLARVLETQAAGEPGAADTRILLSFREKGGRYCRAYASGAADGIACRDESGWAVIEQFAASSVTDGEFQQAGVPHAELFAAAQDMADGPALDSEAEAALREKGWLAD